MFILESVNVDEGFSVLVRSHSLRPARYRVVLLYKCEKYLEYVLNICLCFYRNFSSKFKITVRCMIRSIWKTIFVFKIWLCFNFKFSFLVDIFQCICDSMLHVHPQFVCYIRWSLIARGCQCNLTGSLGLRPARLMTATHITRVSVYSHWLARPSAGSLHVLCTHSTCYINWSLIWRGFECNLVHPQFILYPLITHITRVSVSSHWLARPSAGSLNVDVLSVYDIHIFLENVR